MFSLLLGFDCVETVKLGDSPIFVPVLERVPRLIRDDQKDQIALGHVL